MRFLETTCYGKDLAQTGDPDITPLENTL
ncbi:hypothetical protein F383_37228 [Gossypium arboreum]|uniref:Uncharacterized protein n=1 Tax=Gossypium arboreum TaxID=29729 RepID=A0A0B0M7X0_GOSAR|nr:hypothetical protein F383_37228 [Gossypium arboreum]